MKNLWLGFFLISFIFLSCTKTAVAKGAVKADTFVKTDESTQKNVKNQDVQKIFQVKSKLSPRFQSEFSVGDENATEFLSDLQKVLDEAKKFRGDDLSLYHLIDKKHSVSSDYVPRDLVALEKNDLFNINRNDLSLRPDCFEALKKMAVAAKNDGITLLVSSTYRSYDYQDKLFARWVKIDGLEEAERESARPGTSQHQLGAAIDFGSITDDFDETKMGKWMYQNASNFGWSLSFPKNYEDVTGYRWECWHFRYIGKTACDFQKKWFNNVQQYMLEFLNEWGK